MTYQIRPATGSDLPEITRIYADAVANGTASFELTVPTESEMAARLEDITAKGYPYLVIDTDEGFGGYAYAAAYRARPAYRWTVENSVYMDERMRGRGLGKILLVELMEACASRGFRQMVAVIGDSANRASVRLHESCGFEMTGTFRNVGWKHERWLDTVMMQRALGPGADLPADPESIPGRLFQ